MKKQISNLGNVLSKDSQKQIKGGKMDVTCEELDWNEKTCEKANPEEGGYDHNYYRCC